jgi:(p)ppGpp synthase/HD superfamily hydrolase
MSDHDTLLLAAADALAAWLHRYDTDKQGEPLIGHCRRVAAMLREQGWRVKVQVAGLLHDVGEAGICLDDLTDFFGAEVSFAVEEVTREPAGETYSEYIGRLQKQGNPEAIAIKLADLRDNLDPSRPIPDSLRKRYERAVKRLTAAGEPRPEAR